MKRIGISGVPASGKTTLARALASALCGKLNVELINEYARTYLFKYKSIDSIWEQIRVTEKQIELENNISDKTDIIITDSPIYLGFVFSMDIVNFNRDKDILAYNDLFNKLSLLNNRYDYIFHLCPVIDPLKDKVRPDLHYDQEWRDRTNSIILSVFNFFGQKNIVVISNKDINDRVAICLKYL